MIMKQVFFVILVLVIGFNCMAQSKSEAKKNGIKSVTVWKSDCEESKEKKVKESLTKFDSEGNIIEEIEYDGVTEKPITHFYYEYNSDGNKVKEIEYSPTGKVKKTIEYKYSGELKTEKIVFDEKGVVKSKRHYVYEK